MSIITDLNSETPQTVNGAWFAVGAAMLGLVAASHLVPWVRTFLHKEVLEEDFKTVLDEQLNGSGSDTPAALAITERNRMEIDQ